MVNLFLDWDCSISLSNLRKSHDLNWLLDRISVSCCYSILLNSCFDSSGRGSIENASFSNQKNSIMVRSNQRRGCWCFVFAHWCHQRYLNYRSVSKRGLGSLLGFVVAAADESFWSSLQGNLLFIDLENLFDTLISGRHQNWTDLNRYSYFAHSHCSPGYSQTDVAFSILMILNRSIDPECHRGILCPTFHEPLYWLGSHAFTPASFTATGLLYLRWHNWNSISFHSFRQIKIHFENGHCTLTWYCCDYAVSAQKMRCLRATSAHSAADLARWYHFVGVFLGHSSQDYLVLHQSFGFDFQFGSADYVTIVAASPLEWN